MITDALHRLRTYPRVGKKKDAYVETNYIFPYMVASSSWTLIALQKLAVFNKLTRKPRPVTVATTHLAPTQHGIFFTKMEKELVDAYNKPIVVLRVGSMHYVLDGHHRSAAAILIGQPTIKAYVIESD